MSLVVVALPRADDVVNEISSEKQAHLTILYLGDDLERAPAVASFVEHATQASFKGAFLEVSERGTLGDDDADVLFFEESHDLKQLREFRSLLLKNADIFDAYASVEQFPTWTPHLTLGYPTSPAIQLPPERRQNLSWIDFDRISVWTGDSEGPIFKPPTWNEDWMGQATDLTNVDDIIAHYGVKGMKWGQRKRSPVDVSVKTKSNRKGKAVIKTKGGRNQPASPDAIAAKTLNTQRKKSGMNSMSNEELQKLATRLNLEQQVSRLTVKKPNAAQKFVKDILTNEGKKKASSVASSQIDGMLNTK